MLPTIAEEIENCLDYHSRNQVAPDEYPMLYQNIGRSAILLNPCCELEKEVCTIQMLQFDLERIICYRVFFDGDSIGRLVKPNGLQLLGVS